jgi:hypothetical protein
MADSMECHEDFLSAYKIPSVLRRGNLHLWYGLFLLNRTHDVHHGVSKQVFVYMTPAQGPVLRCSGRGHGWSGLGSAFLRVRYHVSAD